MPSLSLPARLCALVTLAATVIAAPPATAAGTGTLPETDIGAGATPAPPEGSDVTLLVVMVITALVIADLAFHAHRGRRRARLATDADAAIAPPADDVAETGDGVAAEDAPRRPAGRRHPRAGPRPRARTRPEPAAMRASVPAARSGRSAPRGARGPRARPR